MPTDTQQPTRVFLILKWFARACTAFLAITALVPFIRSGYWLVRACDFPRLQFLILSAIPFLLGAWMLTRRKSRREGMVIVTAALLVASWQGWQVLRYTPVWAVTLEDSENVTLSLLVANIDFKNNTKKTSAQNIIDQNADVVLLIEYDEAWKAAMAPFEPAYPHRIEQVMEEGLGIALWSRLPIQNEEVGYLISDERPSIHADIKVADGRTVRFIGLHPTPPGLKRSDEEGRHDSRIRDAELIIAAKIVADDPASAWIVAGDFNDVAWSHTTRLFEEISGLEDPRIGRGLYSTYHAEYPLLRYPIDHVFLSPGSCVKELERIRIRGSDHFAIITSIDMKSAYPARSEAEIDDVIEAQELIEEGAEDAEELGEAVDDPTPQPDRRDPSDAPSGGEPGR